jgi:hypothetical protein
MTNPHKARIVETQRTTGNKRGYIPVALAEVVLAGDEQLAVWDSNQREDPVSVRWLR